MAGNDRLIALGLTIRVERGFRDGKQDLQLETGLTLKSMLLLIPCAYTGISSRVRTARLRARLDTSPYGPVNFYLCTHKKLIIT